MPRKVFDWFADQRVTAWDDDLRRLGPAFSGDQSSEWPNVVTYKRTDEPLARIRAATLASAVHRTVATPHRFEP